MPKRKPTEKLFPSLGAFGDKSRLGAGAPTLIDDDVADTFNVVDHDVVEVELDGVVLTDILGSIQFASETFATMHGYEARELVGRALDSLHDQVQRPAAKVFYDEARRHGVFEGELGRVRRGGEQFVSWTLACQVMSGDDPEGLLVVTRDLSKESPEAHPEPEPEPELEPEDRDKTRRSAPPPSERRIVDAIPDGYVLAEVVLDARRRPRDCRILEVNPAFATMTGRSAVDLVGRTILEVIPDTDPSWIEACGRVALKGTPVRIESESASLNMPLEVMAFSPRFGQVACFFQDITERSSVLPEPPSPTVHELRTLAKDLFGRLESSRADLAKVLQERFKQNLAVVGMTLGMTQAFADQGDTKKIEGIVENAIGQIGEMGETLRTVLRGLRPRKLDEHGLFAALAWHADRTSKDTPLLVLLEGEPLPERLPVETELALFRVAEEALENARDHSKATRAHVSLECRGSEVVLTISDEGTGFDVTRGAAGRGVVTMRERTLAVGGTFEIESEPGHGTRVVVTVTL